ncbi:MAG: LuxR C-terminal-related transcriptional regulator [Lautropia sp.]
MDDDQILQAQRALRRHLLEGESAILWRPGRELAAQLLLYLDDPVACWRLSAQWLREMLDADRVDGGFGGYCGIGGRPRPYVAEAEVRRNSLPLPSVLGLPFDATEPSIRSVWTHAGVSSIVAVTQARGVSAQMRSKLLGIGTAAKLALPVRDGSRPLGLICADWHREVPRWPPEICNELAGLARQVIGPILTVASHAATRGSAGELVEALTPAERRVAQLVAAGLSYKEVACRLDRSLSTVDHQLRSIRSKLGVRSTARLVRLLNTGQQDRP